MKKHLKKITALLLVVIMVFSFAACGSKTGPDDIVAKVNDVEIKRGQVEGFTSIYTYMMGYEPSDLSAEQFEVILQDYVNVEIVRQYFDSKETSVYPDSYDESVAAFIESAHTDGAEFLEKYSVTDEHLSDFFSAQYVTNAILAEIMEEHPEEELKPKAEAYYEENPDYFKDTETGELLPIDDYLESIYYMFYQELYAEKVEEIQKDMTVEIM